MNFTQNTLQGGKNIEKNVFPPWYKARCVLYNSRSDSVVLHSSAGYYGDGLNAIIVFAVCFMPESNQPNYRYIMDNLFK